MIDAYTIGINLALQDGVSTGIALIRRELDALNATLALSMAGLAQFQHSGVQALSHLSPLTLPPVTRSKPPVEQAQVAAQPAIAMAPDVSAPVARAPMVDAIIAPVILPKIPEFVSIADAASPIMSAPLPTPVTTAPTADAPSVLGGPDLALLAMSMLPAPIAAASTPPVDTTVLLADAPHDHLASGVNDGRAASPPMPGQPILVAPSAPAHPLVAPMAPAIAAQEMSMGPARPSMAPQERTGTNTQLSGEVTLDGARLGRWMADQLARGAARAPNGGSGHDPRQGMIWPGGRAQS